MKKPLTHSLGAALAKAGLAPTPDAERERLKDILNHDHAFEWKRLEERTAQVERKDKNLKARAAAAKQRITMRGIREG